MSTLSIGAQGPQVAAWQSFLIDRNYLTGPADGIFGPATQAATEKYQHANGLTPDGVVGPATTQKAVSEGFHPAAAPNFPPPGTINVVFDISHNNGASPDFAKAKAAGMQAVFHKATQGQHFVDNMYAKNRQAATAQGLAWGAYHFGDGSEPTSQADFFLSVAKPDGKTLLVLDFEENPSGPGMTMDQAKQFVQRIKDKTGKYPGLYGGSVLFNDLNGTKDAVLSQCWLWIARYGNLTQLPPGWTNWTFWQYTDGQVGPDTEEVAGIGHCDRDLFYGNEGELSELWGSQGV